MKKMLELIKTINKKNIIEKILYIFILIQPFLSYYFLFSSNIRKVFGFSPSTILRFVFVLSMFILSLIIVFSYSKNKKKIIYMLLFLMVIYVSYTIIHVKLSQNINIFPQNYVFSTFDEILYLLRMLIPFMIIFVVYNSKISKTKFLNMISLVTIFISVTIILTNLLKISLISYSDESVRVGANFFAWFSKSIQNYSFSSLTSKGFFVSPNEISSILLMFLPINCYSLSINNNKYAYIVIFLQIFSMIMISTRISAFGWFLVLILVLIISSIFTLLKRKKTIYKFNFEICLLTYLIFFSSLLLFSPIFEKYSLSHYLIEIKKIFPSNIVIILMFLILVIIIFNKKKTNNHIFIKKVCLIVSIIILSLSTIYISNNRMQKEQPGNTVGNEVTRIEQIETISNDKVTNKFSLLDILKESPVNSIMYIKIFPYSQNSEFWINTMHLQSSKINNTRKVQKLILDYMQNSAIKKYGSIYKYFGMSYSMFRSSNNYNIYIEKDFVMHKYTLGYTGIILFLAPYFIIIGLICYKNLKEHKKNICLKNILFLMALLIPILSSYLSGHFFDEMMATIFYGFILGYFLKALSIKKKYN